MFKRRYLKGALNFFNRFAPEGNSSYLISGQTIGEYEEAYRSYLKWYYENQKKCVNNSYTLWANVIYDSVWALVVAFNQSLEE